MTVNIERTQDFVKLYITNIYADNLNDEYDSYLDDLIHKRYNNHVHSWTSDGVCDSNPVDPINDEFMQFIQFIRIIEKETELVDNIKDNLNTRILYIIFFIIKYIDRFFRDDVPGDTYYKYNKLLLIDSLYNSLLECLPKNPTIRLNDTPIPPDMINRSDRSSVLTLFEDPQSFIGHANSYIFTHSYVYANPENEAFENLLTNFENYIFGSKTIDEQYVDGLNIDSFQSFFEHMLSISKSNIPKKSKRSNEGESVHTIQLRIPKLFNNDFSEILEEYNNSDRPISRKRIPVGTSRYDGDNGFISIIGNTADRSITTGRSIGSYGGSKKYIKKYSKKNKLSKNKKLSKKPLNKTIKKTTKNISKKNKLPKKTIKKAIKKTIKKVY
jgi:hypothetical protein